MAPSHLSLRVWLLPLLSLAQTRKHPSFQPPLLPVFPSPLCLPSISCPSLVFLYFSFLASLSHLFVFSLLLPTSYQTASSASLIESAVKIQMSKSGSFQWRENKSSPLFREKMPTGGDDTVILLCFHKSLSAPHKHHVAVYERLTINPCDLWNNACCYPACLMSCLCPVEMLASCVGLIARKTLMYSLGRAGAP